MLDVILGSRNEAMIRMDPTFMKLNLLTMGKIGEQLIKNECDIMKQHFISVSYLPKLHSYVS